MGFYWVKGVKEPRYTGGVHDAHKWGLPGVRCPGCGVTWGAAAHAFPCVDLSSLPEASKLERGWLEADFEEFVRLRELVRPFVAEDTKLMPGTTFGPLTGPAHGRFGPVHLAFPWMILVSPDALATLKSEGVRGLQGCLTELRFRGKHPQEVLELQIKPRGLLHRDCIPSGEDVPCATCGRLGFSRPEEPILELASLPSDHDIFRLANFHTMIVVTDRFVETARRVGVEDIFFRELPVR